MPSPTPSPLLRVRLRFTGPRQLTVRLSGELDIAVAQHLDAVADLLVGIDARTVHLDLAGIEFIDLAGSRALERLREALITAGMHVETIATSLRVSRLAELKARLADPRPQIAPTHAVLDQEITDDTHRSPHVGQLVAAGH